MIVAEIEVADSRGTDLLKTASLAARDTGL
jgi:hypothetical protein